jgi:hypothetical protein
LLNVVGTYTVQGSTLMLKTVTVDGKAPPPVPGADQPKAWKISADGKSVTDTDGDPPLVRQ